jgi:antirestriction protein ArdC
MSKEKIDILSLIKEEFISENKHIKSIKQLDFYIKRNKFDADKKTAEKFETFLEKNPLKNMLENPFYNGGELTLVEEARSRIESNNSDGVSDFIEYVKEKSKEYDLLGTPTTQILNTSIVYGHPKNAVNHYSGANIETLMTAQSKGNLSTPIFITKTQLAKFGADLNDLPNESHEVWFRDTVYVDKNIERFKKGRYITKEAYDARLLTGTVDEEKVNKAFKVYHFDQLPESMKTRNLEEWYFAQPEFTQFKKQQQSIKDGTIEQLFDEKAHGAIKELFEAAKGFGVKIVNHDTNECFYNRNKDTIFMAEQSRFVSNVAYAGVLAHELGHSTGHPQRLNRKMVGFNDPDKKAYGFEEIVAQTFSELVLTKHGLKAALDHHSAAYIYNYLSDVSMNKKKQIVELNKAVWTAQKAVNQYENIIVNNHQYDITNTKQISSDNTYITEPNDNLVDIAKLIFKGQEVDQELINKAVVLIVKKNKLPDPTKVTASRMLEIPTIEEVKDYEFEQVKLDNKNDLMRKENYVEPSTSTQELVKGITDMFKEELENVNLDVFENNIRQLIDNHRSGNVMFNITDHGFVQELDRMIKNHQEEANVDFSHYTEEPKRANSHRLTR